jgi:dipeptide transport system ATP-binding protein
MIFQEAGSVLNPVLRVGKQLGEVLARWQSGNEEPEVRVESLLAEVGFDDPGRVRGLYPHQLSVGMAQRVQLAMALAGDPELLIADEPTASLDSVGQRQVLELLEEIQARREMALLLVSHDLALVGEFCQRVIVVYAGQAVEEGPAGEVLRSPRHPYTRALLAARPDPRRGTRGSPIPGRVPGPSHTPDACLFADRCSYARDRCREEMPELRSHTGDTKPSGPHGASRIRCWYPLDAKDTEQADG